jgi:DNA-binding NarL/FixJ family response regulator
MNILIVDDHAIVRQGLRQILMESGEAIFIKEADCGSDAIRQVREGEWNVVVLDISLPDRSGIEVLKQIKKEYPKIPVLMLSMHEEGLYAIRALKAGASGYITKQSAPSELMAAIRQVARGRKYLTATLAEAIETTRIRRVSGLTGRHTAAVMTRPFRAPTRPSRMWG